MRLPRIEAEIEQEVSEVNEPVAPPSDTFVRLFKELADRYMALHQIAKAHPHQRVYESDELLSLDGFVMIADIASIHRIRGLHQAAFDQYKDTDSIGRPAMHVTVALRSHTRDAIEAETTLCRAGLFDDGYGAADYASDRSTARLDSFWETIRYPSAAPLYYTANCKEFARLETSNLPAPTGELMTSSLVPVFTTLEEQFDSMHGALDVIEQTPHLT